MTGTYTHLQIKNGPERQEASVHWFADSKTAPFVLNRLDPLLKTITLGNSNDTDLNYWDNGLSSSGVMLDVY